MRNILFLVISLFILGACSQGNSDDIVVKIKVENPTYSTIALVYNKTIIEMPLDEKGRAECTIKNMDALYPRLYYGENSKNLFLQKRDRVTISFDAGKFKDGIQFDGKNAPIIDYLNSVTFMPLPDKDFALPFEEYKQKLDEKTEEALTLLKARKLETVNPMFVQIEEGRILYSYAAGIIMYPVGHPFVAQDTTYRPGEEIYSTLSALMTEREDLVYVDAYRDFITEAASMFAERENRSSSTYERVLSKMKYIGKHLQNEKVKQPLLNMLASEQVEQYGIKNITELENIYNTYVTDPALRAFYKEKYDKWDITSPGRPSPDFSGKDIDGKTYSLKDFKGKYLYIDLWATWCGPCKREIPFLKELEKKFEGKNITFLSLSTDHNKADWEKMVKSGELSGTQLLIGRGSKFQQDYNIEGIPHFILLDQDGKIINSNIARPSSPDIENILKALPNI